MKSKNLYRQSSTDKIQENSSNNKSLSNFVIVEEVDVFLGMIYPCVDIGDFCKNIATFEGSASFTFEQLESNEKLFIASRMTNIKTLLSKTSTQLDEKIKKINIEEKSLKFQSARLLRLLSDTEEVLLKSDTKNVILTTKLDNIYAKTKRAIHDINLKLLSIKDEREEILSNYETMLQELL